MSAEPSAESLNGGGRLLSMQNSAASPTPRLQNIYFQHAAFAFSDSTLADEDRQGPENCTAETLCGSIS